VFNGMNADRVVLGENFKASNSGSEPSHQKEDDQNQHNETQTPTGVISPSCAIGPRGKSADQQQN
jgi:hypothetical protein